ncbi:MAG: VOC family protein [Gaiellaceae bacterium]
MPKVNTFDSGVPCWVDLAAADVEAAKKFYSGLFGWTWTSGEMPQGGTYWGAQLDGAGVAGLMALPPEVAAKDVPSTWNTYIGVANVDATTATAAGAGATVIVPPMDIPAAGRMSFIADPSGAAFGLFQGGEQRAERLVKEHGALVWSEVYAPDTEATVSFYTELFGWTEGSMEIPGGVTYTTFELDGEPVGGTMPPPNEEVPPHWHVWLASDDTEATTTKAAELGADVLVDPTDSPYGKIGSFRDPVGAVFSVIKPAKPS